VTREIPDRRPVAIELLELLSSADLQLDYERRVPHISVSVELVCMWFDDFYFPRDKFFKLCFSKEELEVLAAFNKYYDEHEKTLPKAPPRIADWLQNETWQGIMKEAANALAFFRAGEKSGKSMFD